MWENKNIFDIKKDLKFWDKLKVRHFNNWETRYFIVYFKNWILNTNNKLEDVSWTTISSCILHDNDNLYYNTDYKEFNSLKWEIKEAIIDDKIYKVKVIDRIN
jgi:hypothetical protein